MNQQQQITEFKGEYYFLSNFHPSYVIYEGTVYPTVEHAFQAQKVAREAINCDDVHREMAKLPTPDLAKYYGRKIILRHDWEEIKDGVMIDCLRDKFSREPNKNKLMATGDAELIEGNTWHDNYWGSCICSRCKNHGRNMLGKLLMQVREELFEEENTLEEEHRMYDDSFSEQE